jgi:hypothetical protein
LVKDPAITRKAVDPFLYACAARIVDEDEGRSHLERLFHHLGNLVAVNLTGGAATHREVLACKMYQSTIDVGGASHHAIRRQFLSRHAKQVGAMRGKHPRFLETVGIDQLLNPFTRGKFPCFVLFLDAVFTATQRQLLALLAKVQDLLFGTHRLAFCTRGGLRLARGDRDLVLMPIDRHAVGNRSLER